MNTTLKAICGLLRHEDANVQQSAALVLGHIQPRDPGVSRALGEALATVVDPELADIILFALQQNPHEQSIKYLLEVVGSRVVSHDTVIDALTGIGPKAIAPLKKAFPKAPQHVQHAIAEVMPRIRTDASFTFMVDLFFEEDVELIRNAIHSLREVVGIMSKKERSTVVQKLKSGMNSKRLENNNAALCGLIIALGVVAESKSKKLLLPYVSPEHDENTRRYALLSLAELDISGDGNGDVINALLPILEEEQDSPLVPIVADVLKDIKPRKGDLDSLHKLLESRESSIQAYAIRALGKINTITHARLILPFLTHKDLNLRSASAEALASMSNATDVLLNKLYEVKDAGRAQKIIEVLGSHTKRISKEKRKEMISHLYDLLENNDERYQIFRNIILEIEPELLRSSVMSRVRSARKSGNFARVRDCLRLLRDTEFMTPEIEFQLVVAKLKTSRKELSRAFRHNDYSLELVGKLLQEGGKQFKRDFLKDSSLDLEDLFYVGFHFSERLNEERRFGADVLRHVAKKGKRSKIAKAAKDKLHVEGH